MSASGPSDWRRPAARAGLLAEEGRGCADQQEAEQREYRHLESRPAGVASDGQIDGVAVHGGPSECVRHAMPS